MKYLYLGTYYGGCQECPKDKYNLELNSDECKVCPDNFKCLGGMEMDLDKGYWRENIYTI